MPEMEFSPEQLEGKRKAIRHIETEFEAIIVLKGLKDRLRVFANKEGMGIGEVIWSLLDLYEEAVIKHRVISTSEEFIPLPEKNEEMVNYG